MLLLQVVMVMALLITGMVVALLGTIKIPLARRLAIDEARVGGLVSIFGFVMIPVILTAGFLTDLVGRQAVLSGGSVLLGLSIVLLASARTYAHALIAVLLLGAGWSLVINVANVLTPLAFDPENVAFATNLANVFFGLGAFLTPLLVSALVRATSLAKALSLLAGLAIIPGLLAFAIDFSMLTPASTAVDSTAAPMGMASLLADPIVILCGFALFFYGPLEASLAAWSTSYLAGRGVSEGRASALLSAFWLAYMLARLITAFSSPLAKSHLPGWEPLFILILGLAAAAILLAMVLSRDRTLAAFLVVAAGLVFGPIFPTIVAVLLGHVSPALHGRAVGVLFGIGGIGWTLIPIAIGAYALRTSVQKSFVIAVGAALGLSGIAFALTSLR
jgi:FSR family fosmidomycin resistance protein-like MFS transporter